MMKRTRKESDYILIELFAECGAVKAWRVGADKRSHLPESVAARRQEGHVPGVLNDVQVGRVRQSF
jgi:hypothetical protein